MQPKEYGKNSRRSLSNMLTDFWSKMKGGRIYANRSVNNFPAISLKAGDLVRVRSIEEILATLDQLGRLKGCSFTCGMKEYCNTVQRVLKPMEIFYDERYFIKKKAKNLVLLEGVMCQGITSSGHCDRSCLLFWREEWLEKIG